MKIIKNILPLKEFHKPNSSYVPLSSKQREYVELLNKTILSGTVKFETISCLCGCEEFDLIASYDRYSILQNTVICIKCGLIQSNPRMTEDGYTRFYKLEEYQNLYGSFNNLEEYRKKYSASSGKHIFDTIVNIKRTDRIKSVMEFGVGGGWNLIPFKDEGIDVTGYDYNSSLVSLGNEYGLNLFQGGIRDIAGKYDVIILNHVIEHFTDLIGDIKKLKEHLAPEGIFYIAIPNMKNFSMGQLQNAHTYYFTLSTLQYYMSECGLKLTHYEPAQGIHLATVFVNESAGLTSEFLNGHYEEMSKIFKRYYLGESLGYFLQSVGLKKIMKRVMQNKLSLKLKSLIYKWLL